MEGAMSMGQRAKKKSDISLTTTGLSLCRRRLMRRSIRYLAKLRAAEMNNYPVVYLKVVDYQTL